MSENFYDILGVSEKASQDEIKKAYRLLSLKYHPDKNPGNSEVISKFQKISEAYENIGTSEKRANYDASRRNPFHQVGHEMPFTNIDEIFNSFFGGGMGNPFGGVAFESNDPFFNSGFPGAKIHIFQNGSAGQGPGIHFMNMRGQQKPPPIIKNVILNMEQVLNGTTIPVTIERWIIENGNKIFENETVYVPIPKGIDDNEIIVLSNKGNIISSDIIGDVKLVFKIENDTGYERNGLDLLIHKNIYLKDALCGFSFELKYINNKTYTINNTSGNIIPPDYKKVIPNMGLTRENHTGNLIIVFHIIFPEKLSEEKISLLKDIL
jgi:DnaJ family protein B protein 4